MAETKHHQGFLLVGTEAERGAYSTTGLRNQVVWLESDTGSFYTWNGSIWQCVWTGTSTDTVWDDLRVPLETAKTRGAAVPDYTQYKDDGAASSGVYAYEFDDGDEIYFSVQMPHSWKEGSTIYPHIHWTPSSDVDPSDNVGIGLEYAWADINEDFPANTSAEERDIPTGVDNADAHLLHDIPEAGIDGTGHTISSILLCRLYRQAAVSDNYADPIWIFEFDIHYEMDMAGSYGVTTK